MKLWKKRRDEIRIEYIPLIDCILLLLIFFMSTTTFVTQPGLDIRLPSVKHGSSLTTTGKIEIIVSSAGDIFIDGHPVTVHDLGAAIKERILDADTTVVVIRSDENIAYGRIMDLIDVVRGQGLKRLVLAARLKG